MAYSPELTTLGFVLSPDGRQVLMVHRIGRSDDEQLGKWNGLGGKVEADEDVWSGMARELREEAGIEVGPLSIAVAVDVIDRDEQGRARFHYSILDFCAPWLSGEPVPGDDAAEARFFRPEELPGLGLWAETLRAIETARAVLRRAAETG